MTHTDMMRVSLAAVGIELSPSLLERATAAGRQALRHEARNPESRSAQEQSERKTYREAAYYRRLRRWMHREFGIRESSLYPTQELNQIINERFSELNARVAAAHTELEKERKIQRAWQLEPREVWIFTVAVGVEHMIYSVHTTEDSADKAATQYRAGLPGQWVQMSNPAGGVKRFKLRMQDMGGTTEVNLAVIPRKMHTA